MTNHFLQPCSLTLIAILSLALYGCGYSSAIEDQSWSTREPISIEEARTHTSFEFPEDAKNIQMSFNKYGYVGFEDFIRFEASVASCKQLTSQLVGDPLVQIVGISNKLNTPSNDTISTTSSDRPTWFDPSSITNGLATNSGGGPNHPDIWIDLDNEVFYYVISD